MGVEIDSAAHRDGALPPGPRLPRAAQAMLWTWRYAGFTGRCHERYGDTFTVWLGGQPKSVLTKDRDAIQRLFTGEPLVRRHANDGLRPIVGEQSMFVLEPTEHLARRKMLLSPFHGQQVQSYARLMERLVRAELDRIEPGEVVRVQPMAQALTLDVILQAVLGVSDVQMRERLRKIFNAMITPLSNVALLVPQLTRRTRWNVLAIPYWRLKDRLDALLLEHITASRADERLAERGDILAMMMLLRNEQGDGLTDEQLRDELITQITAGHEATAGAIAWGMDLLVHNPAVLARAYEGDDAYLDALVKEVLRIRSPAAIGGGRIMLEPFTIGEWTIPAGVTILVDAYGVHHDPRVYPQPEEFRPERFLGGSSDGYAFLPFGGGVHRCLGASLARLEIKVVLAEVVKRFELAPVARAPARPIRRGVTLAPRGGARVRILARRSHPAGESQSAGDALAGLGPAPGG
jgi:cytochrome P450 family 135